MPLPANSPTETRQRGGTIGACPSTRTARGAYLDELERELSRTGAGLEAALTIWNARTEEAAWRDKLGRHWATPEVAHRYRIAEGVELLIDARAAPHPRRMRDIVRLIRQAFAEDED